MNGSVLAGAGGLGFVGVAVVVNVMYLRGRLPIPGASATSGFDEIVADFAAARIPMRRPTVLAPASWLLLTVFAAGMLAEAWGRGSGQNAWAVVGMAGVLMQNVTFAGVEALRLATAEAAVRAPGTVAGFWTTSTVLFGFNQSFLATALLGFTVSGIGLAPTWYAVLGCGSAVMLLVSASASPYSTREGGRSGLVGLVGWSGWILWILVSSIALIVP